MDAEETASRAAEKPKDREAKRAANRSRYKVNRLISGFKSLTEEELRTFSLSSAVSEVARKKLSSGVTANIEIAAAMVVGAIDGDVQKAKFVRECEDGALKQHVTVELTGEAIQELDRWHDLTASVAREMFGDDAEEFMELWRKRATSQVNALAFVSGTEGQESEPAPSEQ